MALDAQTVAALVALIAAQGETVTFINPNRSESATREWEVDDAADTETPGPAYVAPVDNRRVDGQTVRLNDSVAYVHAPDAPPDLDDQFRIRRANGDEFQVVDIRTYDSAGAAVLHEIIMRT